MIKKIHASISWLAECSFSFGFSCPWNTFFWFESESEWITECHVTKLLNFMDSLNHDNQADVIEAFNSTSRYLDDLLNIDNPYFEGMVNQIYPSELQLNKANISDTEAPFLDLHLSVANGFVSSKIYDKRDDFDFDI